MQKSFIVVVLLSSALACGPNVPKTLGMVAADEVSLSESEVLGYLYQALGRDMSVADLFYEPEISFERAPDPSELFATRAEAARALAPPSAARPLRVLSYNVGLLDQPMALGFIGNISVPEVEARRSQAPRLVYERGYDILLLQELWEEYELDLFRVAAGEYGYRFYGGTDQHHSGHGLAIAVKEELFGPDSEEEAQHEILFEIQNDLETFPGPGWRRGYLLWRFVTPEGVPLRLYNTHTTANFAFLREGRTRMAQARELGLAIATVPSDEVVIAGGDLNGGAYYHRDVWQNPDDSETGGWWAQAVSYPLLMHYGGLHDMFTERHPEADVELGALVVNNPAQALDHPQASPGYCERTPHLAFTYSECNKLVWMQGRGDGPPDRLDYLLYRPGDVQLHVVRVETVFTERFDFPGAGTFELSDHYGVLADLRLAIP